MRSLPLPIPPSTMPIVPEQRWQAAPAGLAVQLLRVVCQLVSLPVEHGPMVVTWLFGLLSIALCFFLYMWKFFCEK